ncbi:MAG: polyprenyl diphosphate synthase [Candidatus Pacebacteria bacterium]|nr:polyprenyl diphosphate synthase [Candidatus Paceibacterota bacterium]MDD5356884.1 polyprenyl diphosphate synthase [Candidatus Paceibacterota bacterium]
MAGNMGEPTIRSVGVIMDGNRRWAKAKNLFPWKGHEEGYQRLKDLIKWSKESGVQNLIVYAFSTENWKREKEEVSFLMNLARFVFGDSADSIRNEKIRVRCIGDLSRLSKDLQEAIAKTEKETADYEGITLYVCISYGGREEILQAIQEAAKKVPEKISAITEKEFEKYLYTAEIPDPDLIIRTGGEMRLSNFLPWQSVYSELFFTKTLWPDFSHEEFLSILSTFRERKRNFGV